ncbi:MAG: hypothetical protein IPI32_04420 [Austwickia sp.]|nr:hypothetical protein [Austwickia sp.]
MPTRPPTTNTRHRSAALALAALAALAGLGTVAGCASDPPPTPAASIVLPTNPTSEPTPSDANPPVSATEQPATATSTPSTAPAGLSPIPPGARQRTASGAEAFVRYYIAESNRTMTHPRLGVMKPLEMPGCRACGNLERIVDALVNHDVHYTAPPTLISSMGEATEDPGTGDFVMSLQPQASQGVGGGQQGAHLQDRPPASGRGRVSHAMARIRPGR